MKYMYTVHVYNVLLCFESLAGSYLFAMYKLATNILVSNFTYTIT